MHVWEILQCSGNLCTFSLTSELPAQGLCSINDIGTPSAKGSITLKRPLPTNWGATPHMLSGKSSASLQKSSRLLIPFGLSPRGCTLLSKLKCKLKCQNSVLWNSKIIKQHGCASQTTLAFFDCGSLCPTNAAHTEACLTPNQRYIYIYIIILKNMTWVENKEKLHTAERKTPRLGPCICSCENIGHEHVAFPILSWAYRVPVRHRQSFTIGCLRKVKAYKKQN